MLNKLKGSILSELSFHSKYKMIYLVYFLFFFAEDPLRSMLSYFYFTYFSSVEWGVFLTINNFLNVFFPTFVAAIILKNNVTFVSILSLFVIMGGGILIGMFGTFNVYFLIFCSLLMFSGRTIFNNSYGNYINYQVEKSKLTKYLGIRDVFLFSAVAIGAIVCGYINSKYGMRVIYLVFSVCMLIAAPFVYRSINGTKEERIVKKEKDKISYKTFFFKIIKKKELIVLSTIYLSTSVYGTAYVFVGKVGLDLGYTSSFLVSYTGAFSFLNVVFAFLVGTILVIKNRKRILVFDILLDCIPALVFVFSNSKELFLFALTLTLIKDIFAPVTFSYIISCFDDEEGIMALGVLGTLSSLFGMIFPSIFGLIWDSMYQIIFIIAAFLCLLAAVLAVVFLPDDEQLAD